MGTRILPSPSDSRIGRAKAPGAAPPRDVDVHASDVHPVQRRHRWTAELAPLATSVALHAAVIAIGFGTYQTIKALAPVVETQTTYGETDIEPTKTTDALPGGVLGDPNKPVGLPDIEHAPSDAKWESRSSSLTASLADQTPRDTNTMIGIGPNAIAPAGVGGPIGTTNSPRIGAGGGVEFVGVESRPAGGEPVRRVAYVCDATGTMLGLKFELLKQQLAASIDRLKPVQAFNVLFFRGGSSDGEWAVPMKNALLPATPANKAAAGKFLHSTSVLGNGTNPLPALRQAFAQKPQVIYFLTDGEFNNFASYDDVVAEVAKMNVDRKVQVHTILLMSDDPRAEAALRSIAKANGGAFKQVSEADLTR